MMEASLEGIYPPSKNSIFLFTCFFGQYPATGSIE